jgi:hypothetical protein
LGFESLPRSLRNPPQSAGFVVLVDQYSSAARRVESPVERGVARAVDSIMKLVLAALAASVVFAIVQGFAASLGMSSNGLGAGSKVIATCGSGMTFAYTTEFDPGISGYAVDGIELSTIPAGCLNKTLSVTFLDGSDDRSGSAVSATLPGSGTTQTIPIAPSSNMIEVAEISGISVVIS